LKLSELVVATARRFLAAQLFYGHGTDNAHDDAAFLVLRGLGLPFNARDRGLTPQQVRKVEALVAKRIGMRMPSAYLLHEAWLGDLSFYVDERVLVPRSHIAPMLREKLAPWLHRPVRRVLDLCTGSGCLAIVAAKCFPRSRVDAADLSRAALAVAAINVKRHGLGKRVRLVCSDLFALLPGEYDLIVTNPPYVAGEAMRRLPAEYRHEPGLALAGGRDGLSLVKEILREAPSRLTPGGLLVCELGDRRKALERTRPGLPLIWPQDEVFVYEKKRA
jgi:ribosomal protein L3 glutamine methyltransferase